jgi:hypothetical protein
MTSCKKGEMYDQLIIPDENISLKGLCHPSTRLFAIPHEPHSGMEQMTRLLHAVKGAVDPSASPNKNLQLVSTARMCATQKGSRAADAC